MHMHSIPAYQFYSQSPSFTYLYQYFAILIATISLTSLTLLRLRATHSTGQNTENMRAVRRLCMGSHFTFQHMLSN